MRKQQKKINEIQHRKGVNNTLNVINENYKRKQIQQIFEQKKTTKEKKNRERFG